MSYGVGDTGYMGQVNNTAFLERQLAENSSRRADNTSLDFEDMLLLLVTQLQNQSIDNQMDASDMMNQLIQMTVMQSLTEVTMKVEEQTQASVMTYAASLVGKEVTVGVVDERSEIAGSFLGRPQNDVGMRTDVLDSCPKDKGMLLLLRSMSPRVVAIDELGSGEELKALRQAAACGCRILESRQDVERRFGLERDYWERMFDLFFVLGRKRQICERSEARGQDSGRLHDL